MMLKHSLMLALLLSTAFAACARNDGKTPPPHSSVIAQDKMSTQQLDTATLAGGCFWCIEAVFQLLDGVTIVESGYCNGAVKNPSYKEVCSGTTGHAEACRITFDPSVISFDEILQVFFASHDPTTLNKQGNDVGSQYRSAIFTHGPDQEATARSYITQLTASKTWPNPIVTEVVPADTFYKAEDYHQNYYAQNGSQPYCAFVVRPKVEKFMKEFKDKIRNPSK